MYHSVCVFTAATPVVSMSYQKTVPVLYGPDVVVALVTGEVSSARWVYALYLPLLSGSDRAMVTVSHKDRSRIKNSAGNAASKLTGFELCGQR